MVMKQTYQQIKEMKDPSSVPTTVRQRFSSILSNQRKSQSSIKFRGTEETRKKTQESIKENKLI